MLLSWEGETDIDPPPAAKRGQLHLEGDWSAKGLHDPHARLLRPDAVLEIERTDGEDGIRTFLIEYDRTGRVDKNYGKFRRFDAFLNWWWRHTEYAELDEPPFVIFVCQDEHQREQFMAAADHELTGHRSHLSVAVERHEYVGRRRVLFTLERDVHAGTLEAWRLPAFPPDHPSRLPEVRCRAAARRRSAPSPGECSRPPREWSPLTRCRHIARRPHDDLRPCAEPPRPALRRDPTS